MIPESENSPIEPALNGDEPSNSVEDVSVEPNGSDTQDEVEQTEPIVSEEPPVPEAPASAPVALEPEPVEVSEPQPAEPEPQPAAAEPEPAAAEPEPEPAPERQPVVMPVEAGVVLATAVEEQTPAATTPEPEVERPPPEEDATTIAADISQAIAAAAAAAKASAAAAERASAEAEIEMPAALAEPEAVEAVAVAVDGNGAEPAVVRMFQPGDWFVVHTYAGYENKVKANLQSRISSMNMEEKIFEVTIPMEDVMEIKSGKKQVVSRKVFPGYLLVRMDLDDDSWYVVRNTPGVTGFVGSGTKPIPLSEREVDRILQRKAVGERPKPKLEWSIGDPVRVTTGPFANFQGVISEIDTDRSKLKVLVNIFGRETPVELGFDQVAKV